MVLRPTLVSIDNGRYSYLLALSMDRSKRTTVERLYSEAFSSTGLARSDCYGSLIFRFENQLARNTFARMCATWLGIWILPARMPRRKRISGAFGELETEVQFATHRVRLIDGDGQELNK